LLIPWSWGDDHIHYGKAGTIKMITSILAPQLHLVNLLLRLLVLVCDLCRNNFSYTALQKKYFL
jgi:hypothetical protein